MARMDAENHKRRKEPKESLGRKEEQRAQERMKQEARKPGKGKDGREIGETETGMSRQGAKAQRGITMIMVFPLFAPSHEFAAHLLLFRSCLLLVS